MTITTAGIVATYNQAQYVEEAVRGFANQVDEVIVVDDSSADDTPAVLAAIRDIPGLRVLRNDHRLGVSRSYRRAVESTTADLLLIQGGDDRSLPGRAEASVRALGDPEVGLVFSIPTVIDESGRALPEWAGEEFAAGASVDDALGFLFFRANYICAPSVALRRIDFLAHGGFRAGLDLLQDYDLWLALASTSRVHRIEQPLVEYRKHGTNLSREYVGIDSVRQRRLVAEDEAVRTAFLARADDSVLERLASYAGLDAAAFSGLPRADRECLIRLEHPDRVMVRTAVSHLFRLAGEPDGEARMAAMGLGLDDLERFAVRADHENRGAVAQALGVANRLESQQSVV